MKVLTKTLAATAAASLALAPVAAQAGTRAASSPVAVDVQRGSADISGENDLHGASLLWLLLLLAVIAAIVAAATGKTRGG